jgi:hypothetical protein
MATVAEAGGFSRKLAHEAKTGEGYLTTRKR